MSNRYSLGPPAVPKHSHDKSKKRYNLRKSTAWEEVHQANLEVIQTRKKDRHSYSTGSQRSSLQAVKGLSPRSMTSFERLYLLQSNDNFATVPRLHRVQDSGERIGPDQTYQLANSDQERADDASSRVVSINKPVMNFEGHSPRDILLTQAVLLQCTHTQTTSECLNNRSYLLRERLQRMRQETISNLLTLSSKSLTRVCDRAALLQIYKSSHTSGYLRVALASAPSVYRDFPGSTVVQCGHFPDKCDIMVIVTSSPEDSNLTCHMFAVVPHWSSGRHSAHQQLADVFGLPCSAKNKTAISGRTVVTPGGRCNSLDFPSDCRSFVDQVIKTFSCFDGQQLGLTCDTENAPGSGNSRFANRVGNLSHSSRCSTSSSVSSYHQGGPATNRVQNNDVPKINVLSATDDSVFKRPLTPKISNSCENLQQNLGVVSYLRKSFRNKQLFQSQESFSSMSDHSTGSSVSPFDRLLDDARGLDLFEKFCQKQYCAENVHFWKEANQYRLLKNKSDIVKRAKKIFDKYFDLSGDETININSAMFKQVRENLKSGNTSLFDDVQEHIYKLMKTDIYPRFQCSDLYRQYENATVNKEKNKNDENRRLSFLPFFKKNRKSHQKPSESASTPSTMERRSQSKSPSRTNSTISSLFNKPMSVRQMKAGVNSPGSIRKTESVKSINSEDLSTPGREKHNFLSLISRVQGSGLHDQRGLTVDKLDMPDFIKSPRTRALAKGDNSLSSNFCSSQPANLNSINLEDDDAGGQPDSFMQSSPYLHSPSLCNKASLNDLPIGGSLDQLQPTIVSSSHHSSPQSGRNSSARVSITSPSTPKVQDQRKRFSTYLVDLSSSDAAVVGNNGWSSSPSHSFIKEVDESDFTRARAATETSLFTDDDEEEERVILV